MVGPAREPSPRVTERFDATHADCDGLGSLLSTTRGGRQTRVCLDARGRMARVVVPGATPPLHPVIYGYDARGRLETVTQGDRRVRTTYRSDGRVESVGAEARVAGAWTTQASASTGYDPTTRRPVSVTGPGGLMTALNVDAMHQLRGLTPPSRDEHTMGYDGESRMNALTSPAPAPGQPALTLGWRFNARGQLDRVTRADGSLVETTFDETTAAVTDVSFPGLGVLHRERLPLTGATDQVSAPSGCRTRVLYENNGETVPIGSALESAPGEVCPVTGSVTVGLDALGEATSMTVSGAPAVSFTRDADPDRLLTNAGGMSLSRDPSTGRLDGSSVGLVTTTQTYTAYGTQEASVAGVNGVNELELAYVYDGQGRVQWVTEGGHHTRDTTYEYDPAGRLWKVRRGGAVIEQYDHVGGDGANGNRTAWTAGGSAFTASYDGQDRLLSYTENGTLTELGYDVHGNVQTRTTAGSVTTYTWDPRGPLASVQRPGGAGLIEYVLDPAGRRIGRRVGGTLERGWLYAGGLLPVAETDADGSTVRRVFVYATRGNAPDLVRQRVGTEWVTYRVLTDHLGSVRAVVNTATGQVVQRMDYDAFGRVVEDEVASGWTAVPFGYAGGLYDRDTGLVRFGAREYDARIGRWVSRDPILFGGGDANLYRYCGGEPVNWVDANGRDPVLFLEVLSVALAMQSAYNAGVALAGWINTVDRALVPVLYEQRMRANIPTAGVHDDDADANFYHCLAFCNARRSSGPFTGLVLGVGEVAWEGGDADDSASTVCGLNHGAQAASADACYASCGSTYGTYQLASYERANRPRQAALVNWPSNPSESQNFELFRGGGFWRNVWNYWVR